MGLRPLLRRVEGDDERPSGLNQSYGRWETIVSDYPIFSVVQNAFLKDGASWGPVPLFHVSGAMRLFLTTGEGPSGILFEDTKDAIVNFAKLALKCQVWMSARKVITFSTRRARYQDIYFLSVFRSPSCETEFSATSWQSSADAPSPRTASSPPRPSWCRLEGSFSPARIPGRTLGETVFDIRCIL